MACVVRNLATAVLTFFPCFIGASCDRISKAATPDHLSSLSVQVDSPADGLMSMGVYDAHGTLIRSLAAALPVKAGPVSLNWDATTDLGLPAPVGKYDIRGDWFPKGPQAKYVMKVGISGDPPYPLADGSGGWGGTSAAQLMCAATARI